MVPMAPLKSRLCALAITTSIKREAFISEYFSIRLNENVRTIKRLDNVLNDEKTDISLQV